MAFDLHACSRFAFSPAHVSPAEQQDESRYLAVLSDVHANLPALEVVLGALNALGVRQGLVLGDLVGYGPHPSECVERLQQSGFTCLKGNHDVAATDTSAGRLVRAAMSRHARWGAEWTARRLPAPHREWLMHLPSIVYRQDWIGVHGAPDDPHHYHGYIHELTCQRNLDELQRQGVGLCFHGHTHVPGVHARAPGRPDAYYADPRQNLAAYRHALVCAGAVSQPRNGQTGAQFALYDRETRWIEFHNLAYDASSTQRDMRRHGFPDALLRRLEAPLRAGAALHTASGAT
jgi:predicted phosphodiesterase